MGYCHRYPATSMTPLKDQFVFVVVCFIILGCTKQISCPEVDPELANFLPYRPGDSIVFESTDSDSAFVVHITKATVYHTNYWTDKKWTGDDDCFGCLDDVTFGNDYESEANFFAYNTQKDGDLKKGEIMLSSCGYFFDSIIQELDFNGMTFFEVRAYRTIEDFCPEAELLVTSDLGIIRYTDVLGIIWKVKPALSKDPILIVNTPCEE